MHSQSTKTIGILALGVFFVLLILSFGLLYIIGERKETFAVHVQTRAEARAATAQLDALVKLVEETEVERAKLRTYVLSENSVIDFLALVEGIATDVGVSVETQSLAVTSLESSDSFEALVLTILVIGSYDGVTHTLALFELLPYQIHIDDVVLERTGEASAWRGTYTMRVTKEIES